jgi:hypothetical protein
LIYPIKRAEKCNSLVKKKNITPSLLGAAENRNKNKIG